MGSRQCTRVWVSAGTIVAALLAGGCGYSEKMLNAPGPRASGPDQPDVTAAASNSARLQSLPGPVQSAFGHEYAGATVTRVRMEPTGTGAMFYRIVYIQEGKPGQVVYRSDGRETGGGDAGVIVRDEEFVPVTRPAEPTRGPTSRDFQ